eukprot:10336014-Lingulodinium_polyedra.AAC.1
MGDGAVATEYVSLPLCQGLCAVVERCRMEQLADGYDCAKKLVFLPLSVRSHQPLFNTKPEYATLRELPQFDMDSGFDAFLLACGAD